MAFRLDKVIVRGEISNQVRGQVTGKLWLLGRKEPVEIFLKGNCLRDLAGCKLTFENPLPRRDATSEQLASPQKGLTGDMTASRKAKVPTVNDDELMQLLHSKTPVPYVFANILYLEWFSEANGRVVVESSSFRLEISEPAWNMSAPEEETQVGESQENFYNFLDQLTGVANVDDDEEDFLQEEDDEEEEDDEVDNEWDTMIEDEPLNEFEWEQELREADRRAEAYQEAFDRYKDHPERERLIAEAMGWDVEEIEEFRDEWEEVAESLQDTDPQSLIEQADQLVEEDDEDIHHPLSRRAMRFALRLQEDAEKLGLFNLEKASKDSPLLSVIVSIISLGGKLAAALDGVAMGYDPEPGFIIAMLKRSQIPLNEALHSLSSIGPKGLTPDTRMWLATARSELFDLRKDILDVMKEMRQK
jgi:hypothetical protein